MGSASSAHALLLHAVALLALIEIAHWVGDFLLQTDYMALNKSKSWRALGIHTTVVAVVLCGAVGGWAAWHAWVDTFPVALFVGVNWAAHFVTDAVTSRVNAKLWFVKPVLAGQGWRDIGGGVTRTQNTFYLDPAGNRHWFFVSIGADQMVHRITLLVTAYWFLLDV